MKIPILTRIFQGMQIASFVRKVVKDCEGKEKQDNYVQLLIHSVLKHREQLPKCLRNNSEYQQVLVILNEILDLPINEVETLVRRHLN